QDGAIRLDQSFGCRGMDARQSAGARSMRTAKIFALLTAVVCSAAGGIAHAAFSAFGNGSNLLRRTYTLQNAESITIDTSGCGATGSDTVLFLLEGTGGSRVTRGFSDDTGNPGDEFCSHVTFN